MLTGNRKHAVEKLKTPEDVLDVVKDILCDIWDQEKSVELSGRVCNLLQVWLKAFELTKTTELEKRIEALEQQRPLVMEIEQ